MRFLHSSISLAGIVHAQQFAIFNPTTGLTTRLEHKPSAVSADTHFGCDEFSSPSPKEPLLPAARISDFSEAACGRNLVRKALPPPWVLLLIAATPSSSLVSPLFFAHFFDLSVFFPVFDDYPGSSTFFAFLRSLVFSARDAAQAAGHTRSRSTEMAIGVHAVLQLAFGQLPGCAVFRSVTALPILDLRSKIRCFGTESRIEKLYQRASALTEEALREFVTLRKNFAYDCLRQALNKKCRTSPSFTS